MLHFQTNFHESRAMVSPPYITSQDQAIVSDVTTHIFSMFYLCRGWKIRRLVHWGGTTRKYMRFFLCRASSLAIRFRGIDKLCYTFLSALILFSNNKYALGYFITDESINYKGGLTKIALTI